MLPNDIPFEIHITTELTLERMSDFLEVCEMNEAKPLLIELAQGEYISQPMISKVIYSDNPDKVLSAATVISKELLNKHFVSRRLKIEVPSQFANALHTFSASIQKYFEWHGKINYVRTESLKKLCEFHKVHLSFNALKDQKDVRFITLREYGSMELFEKRIKELTQALEDDGWSVMKQQSEYCIYDNNSFLDKGWLPQ